MCRTVKKIKSVKKVIIKKSATKVFQVCISIVYDSFFWNLALALVLVMRYLQYRKIRTSFKILV